MWHYGEKKAKKAKQTMNKQPAFIEKAILEDLPALVELFQATTKNMLTHGLDQWHLDYPSAKDIRPDLERGEVYIIRGENGVEVAATITLNEEQDGQWATVYWKYTEGKQLVIHRLGTHPAAQGKGYAKALCLFAEDVAKAQNYTSIRLDAYAKNEISTHIYRKLGYEYHGSDVFFHGNEAPFYCFEKKMV